MRQSTRERALAAVERARIAVRRDPKRLVSLEEAAAQSALSPIRLHQLFAHVQGETFGAFVRRIRLEYACGLMRAHTEWTCTRIAHEAGYSESSDFTRSFKRAFGLPPSRWDRSTPLNLGRQFDKNRQVAVAETGTLGPGCDTPAFLPTPTAREWKVRIERLEQRRVAVLMVRDATEPERLKRGFDSLEKWLVDRGQLRDERTMMGLSYDSNYETPAAEYRYELAYEVDAGTQASGDVVVRTLPATEAAIVSCRGGYEAFVSAWDYLGRVFMPPGEWVPGDGPAVERYYNDPRPRGMAYWDMDCIQPVRRASDIENR